MKWTSRCLLATALAMVAPESADACSCARTAEMCRGAASAEAVFEATVEAVHFDIPSAERTNPDGSVTVSMSTENMTTTVRFKEIRAIRGFAVEHLVQHDQACRFNFEAGARYLVVLTRDGLNRLEASRCGLTRLIEEATGLVEYVDSLDRAGAETLVWGRAVHSSDLTRPPIVVTPLPNVMVSLQGPTTVTATTDEHGYFAVRGLPPGTYRATTNLKRPAGAGQGIFAHQFDLSGTSPPACAELTFMQTQQ
jgi:hypothetical protein